MVNKVDQKWTVIKYLALEPMNMEMQFLNMDRSKSQVMVLAQDWRLIISSKSKEI